MEFQKPVQQDTLDALTSSLAVSLPLTRRDWRWMVEGRVLISGLSESAVATQKLTDKLARWDKLSDQALSDVLAQLNGFYSLILLGEQGVAFAVDKVRSIPLFFSTIDQCLYISDDANALHDLQKADEQSEANAIDPLTVAEFASALYVNGARTLHNNIQQVQAGEWIGSVAPHSTKSLSKHDYFRLDYQFDAPDNEASFNQGLANATRQAVDNLLEMAGERQIVLPLSGGYDSRLLAIALVERGAPNLLAYSYGDCEQSREVQFAKKVAKTLSIDWIFIPDALPDWKAAWDSEGRQQYELGAANLSSFPLFQDWMAVAKLKASGKLQSNAIFCPGHTGDFVSGGKIPQSIISHEGELTFRKRFSKSRDKAIKQLAQLIVKREFNHSDVANVKDQIQNRVRESFLPIDDAQPAVSAKMLVRLLQDWNWRQRQAKYIVNSVRVYENHGYDWWLPLWDNAIIKFWASAPLRSLPKRSAYIKFVKAAYAEVEVKYQEPKKKETHPSISQSQQRAQDVFARLMHAPVDIRGHDLDNAGGNLWVRNPVLRRLRASIPYAVQEAAGKLKVQVRDSLQTTDIRPVPSQPFSQVYAQHGIEQHSMPRNDFESCDYEMNGITKSRARISIKPVDALGGLALEFLDQTCGVQTAVTGTEKPARQRTRSTEHSPVRDLLMFSPRSQYS